MMSLLASTAKRILAQETHRPDRAEAMSSTDGSISHLLHPLSEGDEAAAQQLWERYFHRLVELAQKRLRFGPRREAAEDVALSAFDSFCRGAAQGRFPQLADRDGLWRLLVVITARKAARHARDAQRQKRGGKLAVRLGDAAEPSLEEVVSREPSPEFAAQAAEECRRLLHLLGDPELESVALLKMEGYTVEHIAQKSGFVPRTIKRKLRLIRTLWAQEMTS
jgi:DNA-directed RNA polymerase specialized sigma24 family protein